MKTLLDTIFGKLTMWFRVLRYSIYAEFKKIGINFLEKKKESCIMLFGNFGLYQNLLKITQVFYVLHRKQSEILVEFKKNF
ncbi:hypothetical protein MUO66_10105 [Candidatus Bathyarchaeota archaeon]|nr:hypothetical protein [Candidatus Bathyarchaeota archaeon]